MPIYEYRCTRGHTFEAMQSMADDPIAACPECGAAVERVFHPVAVHFKGSGFYTTDYGRGRGKAAAESSSDGSKPEGKGESKEASKTASDSTKSGSAKSDSSSSTKSSD